MQRDNITQEEIPTEPSTDEIGPLVSLVQAQDIGGATLIQLIEQGEPTIDSSVKNQKLEQAAQFLANAEQGGFKRGDELPSGIALEIAILSQKQMTFLEKGVIDEEYDVYQNLRNEAVNQASQLDAELLSLSMGDWPFLVRLNMMHNKFTGLTEEQIEHVLSGRDSPNFEYFAMRIVNIVADNAPSLLTEDLKTIIDSGQSMWRKCSAQASIILRAWNDTNIGEMHVDRLVTAMPIASRESYIDEDDTSVKSLIDMSDEKLELYCSPELIPTIREQGYVLFKDLNPSARETLLTRRLFETVVRSSSDEHINQAADVRNRQRQHEPVLQLGDLVHATYTPETFASILSGGLRCGESVFGNNRETVAYPFTVNFLEVNEEISGPESMAERLNLLRNNAYGPINIVLHREEQSAQYVTDDLSRVVNQRQIFGGVPSSEITSIVIREEGAKENTTEEVIHTIVNHGVFIPVYSGSNGKLLFSSEQFDAATNKAQEIVQA